jgi:hypothetical protein
MDTENYKKKPDYGTGQEKNDNYGTGQEKHDDYGTVQQKHDDYDMGKHKNDDDACELKKFERNNYFYGKLMTVDDFKQEQNYFNGKRHLLNRTVSGGGIICGLEAEVVDGNPKCLVVKVSKGVAIDCCGREIVVSYPKENTLKVPEMESAEKRYGESAEKRYGLYLERKDVPKYQVTAPGSNTCDEICSYSRIEEYYNLVLIPLEQTPIKGAFDKKSYCVKDTVLVEVWNPNQQDDDNIEVNISSQRKSSGINIELERVENTNIFRGAILLDTNGYSTDENKNISLQKLQINEEDIIVLKYDNDILYDSIILTDNTFIFNKTKLVERYYKNELEHCPECGNYKNENYHPILLAVLKLADGSMSINDEETSYSRKIVYNNDLLYDLIEKPRCESGAEGEGGGEKGNCIMFSNIIETNISGLKQDCYTITDPIEIKTKFEPKNPPLVYLGKSISDKYDKKNEWISYNEDFEFDILLQKKYSPNSDKDEQAYQNMYQDKKVIFKPINIKNNSFQIFIAKESDKEYAKGTRTTKDIKNLRVRWWAIYNLEKDDVSYTTDRP